MELQRSRRLQEAQEHYDAEAATMNQADKEREEAPMEPNRADIDNGDSMLGDSLGKNIEGPRCPP